LTSIGEWWRVALTPFDDWFPCDSVTKQIALTQRKASTERYKLNDNPFAVANKTRRWASEAAGHPYLHLLANTSFAFG
jgi:hypothetical protein